MISFEKIRLALGCTAIYGGLVLVAWACGLLSDFHRPGSSRSSATLSQSSWSLYKRA